jgi:D-glycero-D-manno-heptose 1,7-bisphosphate phosphatase
MKRRAVFFDRDNTLIVSDGYLGDPDKVVLMEGAADAIARARSMGFATVVVSNQSGVARGMFDENAVHAVNHRLDELLRNANSSAVIDCHDFCPFHPEATIEQYRVETDLRKPMPGMILRAAGKLALDLRGSWLIGDAPRDIEAGQAAGLRTILLKPQGLAQSPAALQSSKCDPEYVCSTLREAIDYIESHREEPIANPQATAEVRSPSGLSLRVEDSGPSDSPGRVEESPHLVRLAHLSEQILGEIKNLREQPPIEFSLSKLFAGIVQIIALALLPLAYLNRNDSNTLIGMLLAAIFLQAFTISLLIMGRQR